MQRVVASRNVTRKYQSVRDNDDDVVVDDWSDDMDVMEIDDGDDKPPTTTTTTTTTTTVDRKRTKGKTTIELDDDGNRGSIGNDSDDDGEFEYSTVKAPAKVPVKAPVKAAVKAVSAKATRDDRKTDRVKGMKVRSDEDSVVVPKKESGGCGGGGRSAVATVAVKRKTTQGGDGSAAKKSLIRANRVVEDADEDAAEEEEPVVRPSTTQSAARHAVDALSGEPGRNRRETEFVVRRVNERTTTTTVLPDDPAVIAEELSTIDEQEDPRMTSNDTVRAWKRTATVLSIGVVSATERQMRAIQEVTNDMSCWSLLSMLDVDKCLREFPVFDASVSMRLQLVLLVERVLRAIKRVSVCARACKLDVSLRRGKASVAALRRCVIVRRELEALLSGRALPPPREGTTTTEGDRGDASTVARTIHEQEEEEEDVPDNEFAHLTGSMFNDDYDDVTAIDEEEEEFDEVPSTFTDAQPIARDRAHDLLQAIQQLDMSAKYFLLNAYQAKQMRREVRFLRDCKFAALNGCFSRRHEDYLLERLLYGGDRGEFEKIVRGTFLCTVERRRTPVDRFERIIDKSGVLSRICTRYVHQCILNYPLKSNGEADAAGITLPRVFVNMSPRKNIDVWNILTTDADLAEGAVGNTTAASGARSTFARSHRDIASKTTVGGDGASSGAEIGVFDMASARFCVKNNLVAMKGYIGIYLC